MPAVTRWMAVVSLMAVAACGGTAAAGSRDGRNAPVAAAGAGSVATPAASAAPTTAPSTPPATPSPARTPVSTPVPAQRMAVQPQAADVFAIRPLVAGGATGTVTTVTSAAGVHYHVVVTGLAPGSAHTVHDHAGSCSSASTSVHLTVLATATADSRGVITFDATVPAFFFGPTRILIVYSSARPVLITGCATL